MRSVVIEIDRLSGRDGIAILAGTFSTLNKPDQRMVITLPDVLAVNEARVGNPIRQIGELGLRRQGALAKFTRDRLQGFLFQPDNGAETVLIIPKSKRVLEAHERIVQAIVHAGADSADISDVCG